MIGGNVVERYTKIMKINFNAGFLNFTCIPIIISVLNMNFVTYISLSFLNN